MAAVDRVGFKPERTTLAVVLVLLLGGLPLALSSPLLAPVLLVPVGALVWVLRARVVATREGLEVCNGLTVRRVRWEDVDRFERPRRGAVVLHTTAGRAVRLTALQPRDLPRLVAVGQPA
jgi:hypothetical protein